MNEYHIGYTAVGAVAGLLLTCLFWMLGGRSDKWLRRYVGGAIIATTVVITALIMKNYEHWLLALYATSIVGFSMGYGGDNLKEKIIRRSTFVVGNMAGGLVLMLVFQASPWILAIHCGVALWTIPLGISSKVHAAAEEVFVCLLLNAGLIMYVFTL